MVSDSLKKNKNEAGAIFDETKPRDGHGRAQKWNSGLQRDMLCKK